jgi:hypothetical protein
MTDSVTRHALDLVLGGYSDVPVFWACAVVQQQELATYHKCDQAPTTTHTGVNVDVDDHTNRQGNNSLICVLRRLASMGLSAHSKNAALSNANCPSSTCFTLASFRAWFR